MRPSWHNYFMQIAYKVSERATCPRRSVGCVIVKDKRILSTGYNGSLPGMPHCFDSECLIENNSCQNVEHSERNAIYNAAKSGVSLNNSTIYVTTVPCWVCFRAIVSSGITEIIFDQEYKTSPYIINFLKKNKNIKMYRLLKDKLIRFPTLTKPVKVGKSASHATKTKADRSTRIKYPAIRKDSAGALSVPKLPQTSS